MKSNKHCKLQNVYRGEKRVKKKMKIKTQNGKIVETDADIWHYIYEKTVINVRKKQCNLICF